MNRSLLHPVLWSLKNIYLLLVAAIIGASLYTATIYTLPTSPLYKFIIAKESRLASMARFTPIRMVDLHLFLAGQRIREIHLLAKRQAAPKYHYQTVSYLLDNFTSSAMITLTLEGDAKRDATKRVYAFISVYERILKQTPLPQDQRVVIADTIAQVRATLDPSLIATRVK